MPHGPTLVWFRHDLRLADQPALSDAAARGGPIVPVFIWAPDEEGNWAPGAASRWWLHKSLASLARDLAGLGSRLIIRRGPTLETLRTLVRETGATAVNWCRRYDTAVIERDANVKSALAGESIDAQSFNGSLLWEPWTIQTGSGTPFKVFTPFWRRCTSQPGPAEPRAAPPDLRPLATWPGSLELADLRLEPRIPWDADLRESWQPGAAGASRELDRILPGIAEYKDERDRPDRNGTSRLSPFLHFGEISPRQVWHRVVAAAGDRRGADAKAEPYLRQLVWREFAYHLLYHFPHTATQPLRAEFARFPWEDDAAALAAWQQGLTGYPYIDAGMRQLWATGWMHNRVRMAVASFLVKDQLIPWQTGARWFWDTLVDADLANNTLGWQWTAGCGADAAPYFRIFNPISQGEKFDPQGEYVRRWVRELSRLPSEWIHRPWEAPREVLQQAEIELASTYSRPLVDHAVARMRALDALKQSKSA